MAQTLRSIPLPALLASVALLLTTWSAAAATKPETGQDPGRQLAEEACSGCHQVAPGQTARQPVDNPDEGPKVRAPSFLEIAKRCDAAGNLRAQITSPHFPMRDQVLTPLDIDSLAHYIRTLAPGTICPLR